tara:strand:- start:926 stop:1690 length:765 start_codon:yes stop_codon:yes gene_type:complete
MISPLKSPITNNKCLASLKKIIPEGSIVHSFLLYDGCLEVKLADADRFVVAHTNKYVNYEFWQCLMADPERLSVIADHFSPIESENIFDILQKEWLKYPDPFIRSGMYYLLNQSSDLNYITSGKLAQDINLTRSIYDMKKFSCPNLHVQLDEEDNFINSILNINDKCDYVFLPIGNYSLNFLEQGQSVGFEQTRVIHKEIKNLLSSSDKKIILLYKFSKSAVNYYKDHSMYIIDKWGRNTESTKFAKEILIANF